MKTEINIPKHVAIIMDGNGRWAQARGLPRTAGHREGANAVRRTIEACNEFKISYLTLYCFSTENWQRSEEEIEALMELLVDFLKRHRKDLKKYQMRLNAIGQLGRLPHQVQQILADVMDETANYSNGVLTLALSYGGRTEIIEAAQAIARKSISGEINPEKIDEKLFASFLYTNNIPDPDLIIRTSNEMRLSNFLTWQSSYSEIYVTPVLWPDFDKKDFKEALEAFSARVRRFGGTDAKKKTN